jgi:uncharacterized protein YdhG (YjbR/CyaY superfamily)
VRGGKVAKNVDAYLKAAPDAVRPKLVQLRAIVKTMVPEAEEGISYGMPYYKYKGALAGFAAFKNHIGFFPGAVVGDFKAELAGYNIAKGTVQLPLEGRLPVALIKTLLKASLDRNEIRALERGATKR